MNKEGRGRSEQAEREERCREREEEYPRCVCAHVYLCDEDTGNAFRIVSLRVGRSKQLLPFPLLKAVQEGWIQDVLQHLKQKEHRL